MQRLEEEIRERLRVMVTAEVQNSDNALDNATQIRIQVQVETDQENRERDNNDSGTSAGDNTSARRH